MHCRASFSEQLFSSVCAPSYHFRPLLQATASRMPSPEKNYEIQNRKLVLLGPRLAVLTPFKRVCSPTPPATACPPSPPPPSFPSSLKAPRTFACGPQTHSCIRNSLSLIMAHSPSVPAAAAVASSSARCRPVAAESRCPHGARRWLHAALAIVLLSSACRVSTAQGTWSTAQLSVARSWLAATSVGHVAIFAGGIGGGHIFMLKGCC